MDYQASERAQAFWQAPTVASSDIFQISTIVNPLVAAASPLLSLATELRHLKKAPDRDRLHVLLCKEIRTFEVLATNHNYTPQVILAARFLICSLLDEILMQTEWGQTIQWSRQKLLTTFVHAPFPDDMFFLILEKSSLQPDRYLDIIELCYFCLNLGFKGKYLYEANGADHLTRLTDKLYHIIFQQRGEFSRQLVIASEPLKQIRRRHKIWQLPPIITAIAASILILTVAFFTYNHRLNNAAAPLNHLLARLESPPP